MGQSCGNDEWIDVNQYYGVYDKSIYFIPMNLKSNKLFGIEVDTVADSDIMQYWTFGDDGKIHWVSQIKTIQKFFAESSSGGSTKFSGFAFFSRQIDPYNFSLKNTSSCNMWRNKTDDDYIAQAKDKLSESFDKVTYSTVVLNNDIISDIRSYNKEKPYTSWDNIRLDGSSQYIDNNDIIIRQSGTSYYKLGCGPLNKGRGVCD